MSSCCDVGPLRTLPPARLATVGCPNRVGLDSPWPSSQSGEVASGNEERSRDTKQWRRSLAAKFYKEEFPNLPGILTRLWMWCELGCLASKRRRLKKCGMLSNRHVVLLRSSQSAREVNKQAPSVGAETQRGGLKDATARLAVELEAGPPVCHPTALDVQVAELKAKAVVVDPHSQDPEPKRPCPNCDEEMQEWMEDRHKDLQAAMVAGRLNEVARVSPC